MYIEEQTTQWPKEKETKGSTKHTHKTKDRVTRTSQKPGVNSGAPDGCSTCGTHHENHENLHQFKNAEI